MFKFLRYYSRKDVQKAIVEQAKDKELGVRYRETFGKRPDILQFDADVFEFARKGASSFHISEETWTDPMGLSTGITKRQLDEQRKGWDLILDIDCPYWDYSKLTGYLLVEALKFHNVKHISVKFSGNKGFHLGVPFESFPDEVNGKPTKELYPDGLRVIAAYLQDMIKPMLTKKILEKESIRDIIKRTGKPEEDLIKDGEFDPFTIIDIDTILISSRHLYRVAYSLHEKSGLASIPIDANKIMEFEKEMADPEKIKTELKFIDRTLIKEKEARELIIQAFDWHAKQIVKKDYSERALKLDSETKPTKNYEELTMAINEDKFPDCIKKILEGKMLDGRKRAIFVLLRFLRNVGWSVEATENKIKEWNKTLPEPLNEGYIISQMMWHKRQKTMILPPNCANENYYKELQLCSGNNVCQTTKNPVSFTKRLAIIAGVKKKVKKINKKTKKSNPSTSQASQATSPPPQPK